MPKYTLSVDMLCYRNYSYYCCNETYSLFFTKLLSTYIHIHIQNTQTDATGIGPIPVAYVCVFCICIYVDKNFKINKLKHTVLVFW